MLRTLVNDLDVLLFVVTGFSIQMRFVMITTFNQKTVAQIVKSIQATIAFIRLTDLSVLKDQQLKSLSSVRTM